MLEGFPVIHFYSATDVTPTAIRFVSNSNRRESLGESAALSELGFDRHLALLVDEAPLARRAVTDSNCC